MALQKKRIGTVQKSRAMLNENKLLDYFLSEAVATVLYIMNRTPTTIVHGMMPEEKYTDRKLDISHLCSCS